MSSHSDSRRLFLRQSLALSAALPFSGLAAWAAPKDMGSSSVTADTTLGKVRGLDVNGIKAFKGIPYGASTAGKNRFMPPVKAAAWTGVRDATDWGHISPQVLLTNPGDYERAIEWEKERGGLSEDCLNVNVWTPAVNDGGKRTVMVSYHGGGYTTGSGNLFNYDGDSLARFGNVVVVTVNHRLGALGYTDLSQIGGPEYAYSGVAGMMDCVAALEWVRDNIEHFGGNPSNVMIFGQSGGGSKTSTLLSMPSAKGLYNRAAVQSGSTLKLTHREVSAKNAAALLAHLQIDKSNLSALQNVPFEKIIAAQDALAKQSPPIGFAPVVDGKIIPRDPFDPTAPEVSADVPMIVSTTLEDAALRMTDWSLTEPELKDWAQKTFAGESGHILSLYNAAYPGVRPFSIKARIMTDRGGRRNAILMAERKSELHRAPAYLYRWDWPSPAYGGKLGAVHGMDVPLAFHNPVPPLQGNTPEARQMGDKLAAVWVAFAKTGDPNCKAIPHWPAYNLTERPTMIFDLNTRVVNDPDKPLRLLWSSLAT